MVVMEIILAIIFGGAVVTFIYETYYEKKDKKVGELLAPKAEELIEVSSRRIFERQKELKRNLTAKEKNEILDECYTKL